MRSFSLLVKPASADCNLRCDYCFYLDRAALFPDEKKHRMSDKTLEKMIRSCLSARQSEYAFTWQGGEPTLMGVDFFKRVVELQAKYGESQNAVIANALQTNGTLITDEMAKLFAEYNFLVGVSLDGPRETHDRYRKDKRGGGSHAAVLRGIDPLRKHGVEFNILSLVSRANVDDPALVYKYLKEQGFAYHQYIPCVEMDSCGARAPYSITGDEWGEFLCGVFDEWYADGARGVSVRLFDSILNLLVDNRRTICHFGDDCRQYLVVEYDGGVYPCDFFVERELKLGNLMDDSWADALDSDVYREFGARKRNYSEACGDCEWLWICAGDCLKNRLSGAGGGAPMSLLCSGWKHFFDYSMARFRELAEEIKRERKSRVARTAGTAKVGRNDACPCGSGGKFKKCCGRGV